MSVNDKASGPKVGMRVWYNNAGTIVAADILAVAAAGTVSLNWWSGGTGAATFVASANFSAYAQTTGTWGYPDFL